MADWIIRTIESTGYVGIALLMFLENVFPPIPSEFIMPLAGFMVSKNERALSGVVLAGTIGSVMGALPFYYAGYFIGEARLNRWIGKHGRWLTVSQEDLERAKRWFAKHGPLAVLDMPSCAGFTLVDFHTRWNRANAVGLVSVLHRDRRRFLDGHIGVRGLSPGGKISGSGKISEPNCVCRSRRHRADLCQTTVVRASVNVGGPVN